MSDTTYDGIDFEMDATPTGSIGKSTERAGLAPRMTLQQAIDSARARVSTPADIVPSRNPDDSAGKAIKPDAKVAADAEVALAESLGVKTEAIYANGTQMLAIGEAVAKGHRLAWEKQPLAVDGAIALAARITQEERREVAAPLNMLVVDGNGMLVRRDQAADPEAKRWSLTETGYAQLQERAPAGAVKRNLNAWLAKSGSTPVMRTRRGQGGQREVFAAVSKRYAVLDAHDVARIVSEALPRGVRLRDAYRAFPQPRGTLDFTMAPAYEVDGGDIGVGRIHRFGVRVKTADDATGSIQIGLFAERIACINCTLMQGTGKNVALRHVGDSSKLQAAVIAAANELAPAVERFKELWRAGNEAAIHRIYDGTLTSARAVFQRLVANGYVNIVGHKEDAIVDGLVAAWNREPGDTYASVHNAITRLAHEGPESQGWGSRWVTDDLEEQASQLLYARVWAGGDAVWADRS